MSANDLEQQIHERIATTPIKSLQGWLRSRELPHSARNSVQFREKILSWVESGQITLDQLEEAVLDIEENGGKKVFLRKAIGSNKLASKDEWQEHLRTVLKRKKLKLSDVRNSIRNPKRDAQFNYVYWFSVNLIF